jgi:hypothetical protein
VYRNLSNRIAKQGRFSIQSREGADYGLVIGHANLLELVGCEFKVSLAGRHRVLQERRKNVHAGVLGRIKKVGFLSRRHGMSKVSYDPYRTAAFTDENGRAVKRADRVIFRSDGVFYKETSGY